MLISLTFSNFYSFAQDTHLSFEVGKKPAPSSYDVKGVEGYRLNKVLAVVGPNGGGKTQFIKPLGFLSWLLTRSFLSDPDALVPYEPHRLHEDKPTNFQMTFILNGKTYRYEVELFKGHIISEALRVKTSHLFSYIFERTFDRTQTEEITYICKQQGFGFQPSKARSIRSNASLIPAAHNYDVDFAKQFVEYFSQYAININVTGRDHFKPQDVLVSADVFQQHGTCRSKMMSLIRDFDLGISSIEIIQDKTKTPEGTESTFNSPYAIHETKEGSFTLPLTLESSGTQSAFVLLARILPVLQSGGVAIIDEIDNDLHPHMLPKIIELFKFEHSNPHQAQIVFTCHTPEIFNLLKKHQIYLVEKENLFSDAWRLDEVVGLRADDNLYAKYMAGALSAVPDF